jgi:ABC-type transport system substrate-binding protein
MSIRRILIFAPLVLFLFLLQSYFWVPTYEEQTRGNPERLNEYITASIGDAAILNPILSSDSASSDIEGLVFEGLIDRDENLRFRGRLATSWEIFEEALFYINEEARVPGFAKASPEDIVQLITKAKSGVLPLDARVLDSLNNIREISIIPPERSSVTHKVKAGVELKFEVRAPARIKMVLNQVDQELFENLSSVLGEGYFSSFPSEKYLDVEGPKEDSQKEGSRKDTADIARAILPATEHNPVLLFHLRPNVKFHDGHVFDAGDVKFTYEAIMNLKNISPRQADYEPVKKVEVITPLTLRIVYKRLYSPAIGTWAIGILPEHLLNKEALRTEAVSRKMDPDNFSMRQSLFNRHPMGCGPFVIREWKSDQYISLDRFEESWEGPPNYKRYAYRIIPDLLTQEMEFYAGTVDNYLVQPHQVERLEKNPAYQSFSGPSFGYSYIGYNMRRQPFDDGRVRLALGMAIDTDKIIKYVLYGQGENITGPFVKQTDYYNHHILRSV